MSSPKWKLLKSEFVADLKIFKARFDYLLNPHNQKEVKVTVLDALDAANVIALNEEGKILMIHQYRFGTQEYSLEVPGGFIEAGETPLQGAKRELADIDQTRSTNFDDEEHIVTQFYTLQELKKAAQENKITHPHTISALARMFNIFDAENG